MHSSSAFVFIPRAKLSLADIEGLSEGPLPALWDAGEESRLVGYANDVAALVADRIVEQAQNRLGILMRRVSGGMTAHSFSLALEKNGSSYLDQKENPDPASHIDWQVGYTVKICS